MKLLNAIQIHEWDAYSIEKQRISSWQLMEKAAAASTEWIKAHLSSSYTFYVFCGKGNNGGDGLAIARLLLQSHYKVTAYVVENGKVGSADFEENLQKWQELNQSINVIHSNADFPTFDENIYIIDALFGSGLNKPLRNLEKDLVEYLNELSHSVISIDIPSGMYLSENSKGNTILNADHTLTFQSLKLCFLIAENAQCFGKVEVLDIGLENNFPQTQNSNLEIVDMDFAKSIYKPRSDFGHKGSFGHALLIAGSNGKTGAALMAAHSCLRTGAGLLTCNFPEEARLALSITLPEAMSMHRNDKIEWEKYKSIGIGPGLGTEALELLQSTIEKAVCPILIDADGLNIISENPDLLYKIPKNTILTPHPKEFERLFGKTENELERIHLAIKKSAELHIVIVLKGHNTLIAYNGLGYFNTTGNVGLATGGSGDTLTGILTSLLAQGYTSKDAAILGVYLHGKAADLALENQSVESLLPSDLNQYLGKTIKLLLT